MINAIHMMNNVTDSKNYNVIYFKMPLVYYVKSTGLDTLVHLFSFVLLARTISTNAYYFHFTPISIKSMHKYKQ